MLLSPSEPSSDVHFLSVSFNDVPIIHRIWSELRTASFNNRSPFFCGAFLCGKYKMTLNLLGCSRYVSSVTDWRDASREMPQNDREYGEMIMLVSFIILRTDGRVFLDLSSSYIPERLAQVGMKCARVHSYVFTRGIFQLKSTLQHTGTWSAAACTPYRLCYRPAVFLHQHRLIAASLPKGEGKKSLFVLKYYCSFFFAFLDALTKFRRAVV